MGEKALENRSVNTLEGVLKVGCFAEPAGAASWSTGELIGNRSLDGRGPVAKARAWMDIACGVRGANREVSLTRSESNECSEGLVQVCTS